MMRERAVVHLGAQGYAFIDLQTGLALTRVRVGEGAEGCAGFVGSAEVPTLAFGDVRKPFLHFVPLEGPETVNESRLGFAVPERLTAVAFSSCGTLCLAGGESGSAYVWHLPTGSLLRCWRAHFRPLTFLRVTADDGFVMTAGADGVVRVYALAAVVAQDAASSRASQEPPVAQVWAAHKTEIAAVDVCSAGRDVLIASAGADQAVHVWRLFTDVPMATYTFSDRVIAVAFDAVSLDLFVAAGGCVFHLRQAHFVDPVLHRLASLAEMPRAVVPVTSGGADGAPVFSTEGEHILSVKVNTDGTQLFTNTVEGIRVWDIATRQSLANVPFPGQSVRRIELLAWSKDDAGGHGGFRPRLKRLKTAKALPLPAQKPLLRIWSVEPPNCVIVRPAPLPALLREAAAADMPRVDGADEIIQLCDRLLSFSGLFEVQQLSSRIEKFEQSAAEVTKTVAKFVGDVCDAASRDLLVDLADAPAAGPQFYGCNLPLMPSGVAREAAQLSAADDILLRNQPDEGALPCDVYKRAEGGPALTGFGRRLIFPYVERTFALDPGSRRDARITFNDKNTNGKSRGSGSQGSVDDKRARVPARERTAAAEAPAPESSPVASGSESNNDAHSEDPGLTDDGASSETEGVSALWSDTSSEAPPLNKGG